MAGFPPGPRGLALVQGAALSRDPLGWIERQRSRYGNVFSARFPYFGRVVYLAHPEAVKEAFGGSPALMHAGEANAGPLGAVLGTYSLLTLDDEPHMEQRKLLLPPFHGDNVRLYGEVMAEAAAREVDGWSVGRGAADARRHAADHARGDPAGGVRRARRGAAEGVRAAHPAAQRREQHADLDAVPAPRPVPGAPL